MFISIEVGGTSSRIASFNSFDHPRVIDISAFRHTGVYKDDLENIASAVKKLATSRVEGIGLSLVGILNEDKSQLKIAPNLPSWMGQPIKKDLESIFQCPVVMDNNGTAAAVGEAMFGYGKGKSFVMIAWGTGIGGTAVETLDGQIHISPFEPGHVPLDWNGDKCACGQRGCLETTSGGAGIEKKYGKPAKELNENEWEEVVNSFTQGLMNVVLMRPTKLVVLTGSVAVKQVSRLTKISRILRDRLKMFDSPELKISRFKESAGLYGALAILKRHLAGKHV